MAKQEKSKHHREPALGHYTPFSEVWPEIKNIDIRQQKIKFGTGPGEPEPVGITVKIDCFNPLCKKGGFKIQDSIQSMYDNRKEHGEFRLSCNGYESVGKSERSCFAKINLIIDIEYKENEEEDNSNED